MSISGLPQQKFEYPKVRHRKARHRKNRHRKTRHRKFRHRKTRHRKYRYTFDQKHTSPCPTPSMVWRDERPLRCANQKGNKEPTHKKQTRRGKRSETQIIARKAMRKEKRRRARCEYRRVRKRWETLARAPTKLTLAQERILAEHPNPETNLRAHDHNSAPQTERPLNTTGRTLKIATYNVKGMNYISARQRIIYLMKKHQLDIVLLQETHINYTGKEIHEDFTFYFSSVIEDEQRKSVDSKLEDLAQRVKRKTITEEEAKRERMEILNISAEKLGVGIVFKNKILRHTEIDITSVSNRLMIMRIGSTPVKVNLVNVYAPHSGHNPQTKTDFYHSLTRIIQETPKHETNLVLGDFNARIMEVLPQEQHLLGDFIYREADSSINHLSQGQVDNRHRFIEFCADHQLTPMNTWFEKPIPKLATYRIPTVNTFDGVNIDISKYSQLDYILINDHWKNAITDIQTIHHTLLDSDHALQIATLRVKLAKKKCSHTNKRQRYRTPTDNELIAYNLLIQSQVQQRKHHGQWYGHDQCAFLAEILQTAAKQTLTKIPINQKKDYISAHTWKLIEDKAQAIEQENYDLSKQLSKIIKQEARKDKEDMLLTQLEELDAQGYKWDGLKAARKTFQPKRTKFKNRNNELIKEADFANEAAKYLAEVQWAQPEHNDINQEYENKPLYHGNLSMQNTNFTLEELNKVINAQKNNKSPGPDNCIAELTKWLNDTNRSTLLEILNSILDDDDYPDSLKEASIVSIYKKGDATQMKNYRPIALLQTFYKILAGIIKNRLLETYDTWVQDTQYGFRPKKSTAQAIFIARRLMDISERAGTNLTITLLDWKMAFDKVNQTKLLQVLRRLRVPPRMLKLIQHIYSNPKFRVSAEGRQSESMIQNSGIRQGCPLSPYLFVLLMSAMFTDIKSRLNTPKQQEPIRGIKYTEILYADDTLIFGNYTKHINMLLAEIQRESSYYNMELNLDKCINLTLNRHQSSIRYMDGTLVPRKQFATYLGTLLTDTVDNRKEIMSRIFDSTRTCNKLKLFWNKARTSLRWKIKVFHSIIRSKLLYGLECIQLNQAERNKLNAFQIKCYRRILHIPPTSVDRTVTNEDVKRILQDQQGLKVADFSDMWIHKKIKLLGHIIRSHNQDPMKQVLFEPYTLTPRIEHARRVGKPRAHWLIETYADAYKAAGMLEQFDMENIQHRNVIHDMAMQRTGIFQ